MTWAMAMVQPTGARSFIPFPLFSSTFWSIRSLCNSINIIRLLWKSSETYRARIFHNLSAREFSIVNSTFRNRFICSFFFLITKKNTIFISILNLLFLFFFFFFLFLTFPLFVQFFLSSMKTFFNCGHIFACIINAWILHHILDATRLNTNDVERKK